MNWLELISEIAYIVAGGAAVTAILIYRDIVKGIKEDLRSLRSTTYALYSNPENSEETRTALGLIDKEISHIIRTL